MIRNLISLFFSCSCGFHMQFYYLGKMCIFDMLFLPKSSQTSQNALMALKDFMFYICAQLHWKHTITSYQYQYANNKAYRVKESVKSSFKWLCLLALYNIVSVFWIFLPSHALFATRHSILSRPTIKSFYSCILHFITTKI